MSTIYDYMDYRAFLKDRFTEMKRKNPLFSYQSFSRLAGAKSTSFLKLVIDSKRNLADEGIRMVSKGFRLAEAESKYLECLVKFNQAQHHEEKNRYFRELSQNKRFLAAKPMTAAQYQLFSHWYYVAILELVRVPSNAPKDAKWLQEHINPSVGLREMNKAVKDLKAQDLLVEDPVQGLVRKETMLTTDDEIQSLSVANIHVQMSRLAARAVMEEPAKEREFSSLTVVTSEQSFLKAKEEIQKFRKKLHSILEQEDDGPKIFVGQLNLQLFKLSKLFIMLLITAVCGMAAGCNERTHPGIELGNPDITVNSFRVVAEDGADTYDVALIDRGNALVTRSRSIEAVSVPYRKIDNTLSLEAVFSDGQRIGVTTVFGDGGAIESGQLTVDGEDVEACFEIPGLSPECAIPSAEDGPSLNTDDTKDAEEPDTDGPPALEETLQQDMDDTNIETPDWRLPDNMGAGGAPPSPPPVMPLVKKPGLSPSLQPNEPIRLSR